MSSNFRQSATRRKITYFAIIIALFVSTTFVRGLVAMPPGKIDEYLSRWNIAGQAERLEMTESTQGEMELTGSAVRLLLTGSRGLMICALWNTAIDKQKKHEWNELELLVRSITKLQPYFITPWMFQSWNLTYNVSVEMDNLGDMYFYIARGISLLAEGEAVNHYNPDMRYFLAFYYQNKFGVSDKVTTLRCLLQLSCIKPSERNILELKRGNQIQTQAFEEFCKNNPRLVRKLREMPIRYGKRGNIDQIMYLCATPNKVVEFIGKHKTVIDVVSRYRDARNPESKELDEDYLKQFPVLPPKFGGGKDELNPTMQINDADSDAHLIARAWFTYANEAIPLPSEIPGQNPVDYVDPERKRRVPRQPAMIIFRQGPPRAQTYVADWLAKEGWFDKDPWIVDQGIDQTARWFSNDVKLVPTATSKLAWNKANDMWEEHGRKNGLLLSDDRNRIYNERAKIYARSRGVPVGSRPEELRPSEKNDPEMVAGWEAQSALFYRQQNLQVTQFDNFFYSARVEQKDETVTARKKFFEAERYRLRQEPRMAIPIYESAFAEWKKILYANPEFRKSDPVQREIYEQQLNFMRLLRESPRVKSQLVERTRDLFGLVAPIAMLSKPMKTVTDPLWFEDGPLDGVDKDGKPWIREDIKFIFKSNQEMEDSGKGAPKQAKPKDDVGNPDFLP